jgi:hypothetical protein
MKIVLTEQQLGSVLDSMLDDTFKGYEVVFKDNGRNIYVNGKLLAILEPTKGSISADIYHDLKNNLFYDSDKDLKSAISDWVDKTFGVKKGGFKYGISFKKLHGDEKDIPKKQKPRDPRGAEKGFDIEGFRQRTGKIEDRLNNKEDLIRAARRKMNPDTFENWWKRETDKHNERERKEKEKQLSDISKMVARLKSDNK